jgi:menaquinone-9 beta-reductase
VKKHHSIIVIGGGPAGSSSAYTLSKHGLDVCIIDKAVFPRKKLCGGLLTLRSKKIFSQIFDTDWNEVYEYKSNGVEFFYKNISLNKVENYSELFFTCRNYYDNYLLRLAEAQGTHLYLGDGIDSIDLNKKLCRLRSGQEISYDYLIGADGVNSIVAKAILKNAYNKQKIAIGLEIEVDRAKTDRLVTSPEIHLGIMNWGYGWVFPKQNTLTVGVGGIHVKNPAIKEDFKRFLFSLFGEMPLEKMKGHYIPFGDYKKIPGTKDVLLAGDAAGLVEPITGEGIAFAMQSGYFAGLSIVEGIHNKIPVFEVYQKKYNEIAKDIAYANKLRHLIFPKRCEQMIAKVLPKTRQLPLKHLDLMSNDISYEEYAKFLIQASTRAITRPVRNLFISK